MLTKGGESVEVLATDISDWTFVDTGMATPDAPGRHLEDDGLFLANYGDVADAPMNEFIAEFLPTNGAVAAPRGAPRTPSTSWRSRRGLAVRPGSCRWPDKSFRINGGYFVLRQGIFDYMGPGEDLVMDAFVNAAAHGRYARRVRRLLGTHGHPQGTDDPRGHVPPRRMPLGGLADEPSTGADAPRRRLQPGRT